MCRNWTGSVSARIHLGYILFLAPKCLLYLHISMQGGEHFLQRIMLFPLAHSLVYVYFACLKQSFSTITIAERLSSQPRIAVCRSGNTKCRFTSAERPPESFWQGPSTKLPFAASSSSAAAYKRTKGKDSRPLWEHGSCSQGAWKPFPNPENVATVYSLFVYEGGSEAS